MFAHDRLDRLSGLVGVVERYGADIMVEYVGFDNTVQELAANEPKLAIDGCSCTTSVGPRGRSVVRKAGVGVLKERDSN